jgi:hypothetical protein
MSKFAILVVIAIFIAAWIYANPRDGKFGYSTFGLTTYNAIPIPYFDLKIRSNGVLSLREEKNHTISLNEAREILNKSITGTDTDILIIGTGYEGKVKVDSRIFNATFVPIEVMPTPKALKKFNELKDKGKKVAAIIHSTC